MIHTLTTVINKVEGISGIQSILMNQCLKKESKEGVSSTLKMAGNVSASAVFYILRNEAQKFRHFIPAKGAD